MKKIAAILVVFMIAILHNGVAQTVYTVNTNSSYPANCSDCTFNIASGVTLTISKEGTCSNCSFNGGNIAVENNIKCQPCTFVGNSITMTNNAIKPNSKTTSFTNVQLTANGASSISANTPVSITNSTFTFNGTSYFNNNGGQLDLVNSTLNFFDNAYFNANAGPVNLKNGSKLVAGNGLLASKAYIQINGPALNIYDNSSSIVIANNNNYYSNWSSFNSISNGKSYSTTYPSAASTLNCGAAGQNACGLWSNPTVYGPAAFASTGVAAISSTLPVVLGSFTVANNNNNVNLAWTTTQEINAAYFIIERSSNGASWDRIGSVNAHANTSSASKYGYTDASPLKATAYYRLAMVDLDGKKEYSAVKTIQVAQVSTVNCYPNPATEKVTVSLSGGNTASTVKLMTQSGQVLQQRKAGSNTQMISIDVQQYPRGMYIVSIESANGTTSNQTLVIAH